MTSPATRRRPPGRYDAPSRTAPRALAILLSVLFLGFLAAIAWYLFQRYGVERVPVQVRGFSVVSDSEVRVDFEVTPPPGEQVYCVVRARDATGAETGQEVVPVRSADNPDQPVVVRHELATAARAVTGEVPGCSLSPPPAPSAP